MLQSSMLQSIQRYMDEAIMDKGAAVASAALVSALVSFILKYHKKNIII